MKKSLIVIPIILVAAGGILTKKINKERHIEAKLKDEKQDGISKCCYHNLPFSDKSSKERTRKKPNRRIKPENKSNLRVFNMPVIKLSVNVQLGFFNNEGKK